MALYTNMHFGRCKLIRVIFIAMSKFLGKKEGEGGFLNMKEFV